MRKLYQDYYTDDETVAGTELLKRFESAQDWCEEILDLLYGNKEYKSDDLEYALEEMAGLMNVKLPAKQLKVKIGE